MRHRHRLLVMGFCAAGLLLAGCGDAPAPSTAAPGPMRIVTLAPALTQMIVDLGAADLIVGVAEQDIAVPGAAQIVGNYLSVNTEKLLLTKPTDVFMTPGKEGPPARLRELADAGRFKLHSYPYPDSVGQVFDILFDDRDGAGADTGGRPTTCLGVAVGRADEAAALRRRMVGQLARLSALVADRDRPAVLLVIGTSPVTMVSGPRTVNDELLVYAGGTNAAARSTVMAPTFDREALLALAPEVILLLMPDAPDLEPGDIRLGTFRDLAIPAVENDRIRLINDPAVQLPSTTLPHVACQMAKAIHPQLADQIDRVFDSDAPLD